MPNDMTRSYIAKAAGNEKFHCNEFVAVKKEKKTDMINDSYT